MTKSITASQKNDMTLQTLSPKRFAIIKQFAEQSLYLQLRLGQGPGSWRGVLRTPLRLVHGSPLPWMLWFFRSHAGMLGDFFAISHNKQVGSQNTSPAFVLL